MHRLWFLVLSLVIYSSHAYAQCVITYPAESTPPVSYAASWSPVSGNNETVLTATCAGTDLNITAGSTGSYVHSQGYKWDGSSWQSFSYSGGTPAGSWFNGTATATISQTSACETTYFVAYVCRKVAGSWKCGCRDSTCATAYWSLQGVN